MRLTPLVLLLVLVAALVAVPASAKDGVRATLTTQIPLDAAPGSLLHVGWALHFADEQGRQRSFGGSGVFVRLRSASGAATQTGFSKQDHGEFTATVAVPEGGIGDVEIGIRGWTSKGDASDLLFPITNEPRPASGGGSNKWIFVLVGIVAAAAVCALAIFAARRGKLARVPSTR